MRARRFDIFHISLSDISALRAYRKNSSEEKGKIVFSYQDSMKFRVVRKRNTQLFDALYRIHKEKNRLINGMQDGYVPDEHVIRDYLYDAIVVNMRPPKGVKHAVCLDEALSFVSRKKMDKMAEHLYERGFSIKDVPVSRFLADAHETGKKDLKYVPFVSSASMARQSEYLFVRSDVAKDLMEKLSLGLLTMDEQGNPLASQELKDTDSPYLSPAKISAYIGLALSDGQSIDEMAAACKEEGRPVQRQALTLNEKSVICVQDYKDFPMDMDAVSKHVWKMHAFDPKRCELKGSYAKEATKEKEDELSEALLMLASMTRLSANCKDRFDADLRMTWCGQINSVTMADLDKWQSEEKTPVCRPVLESRIDDKKQYAFIAACLLADGAQDVEIGDAAALANKQEALCQAVNNLNAEKEKFGRDSEALRRNEEQFRALKAHLGKPKDSDTYQAWQIRRRDEGGYRLEFEQLRKQEKLTVQKAKPEDEYKALCQWFAMLGDPQKNQKDFTKTLAESCDLLVKEWKKVLDEVGKLPKGIHQKRLPAAGSEDAVRESLHGYGFAYAAAIYLKQLGAEEAGDRKLEIEEGELTAAINILKTEAVERLTKLDEQNKTVLSLWNSVRENRTELFSAGIVTENNDDSDEIGSRSYYNFVLHSKTMQPFMARLTENLPVELCELLKMGAENEKPEDFDAWIEANGLTAAAQLRQWALRDAEPDESLGQTLHLCCKSLNADKHAFKDGDSLWNELSDNSELLKQFKKRLKKQQDQFFENTSNFYDGCGFADEAFFHTLTELMNGGKQEERDYNAVIIRLPWVKGLLIKLNWQDILREKTGAGEGAQILDVFNIKRNLDDAHVLLSESMFKGLKQIRNVKTVENGDHWAYFWKKIEEYKSSMLIAGRNSMPKQTSRLNYQFLATNCMDKEKMKKLVCQVLGDAIDLYSRPEDYIARLMDPNRGAAQAMDNESSLLDNVQEASGDDKNGRNQTSGAEGQEDGAIPPETDPGEEDEEERDFAYAINETLTQLQLLKARPDFADTQYMRKAMMGRMRALILEMMRGQIPDIRGDVRFIVPDLDAMLSYIGGFVVDTEENNTQQNNTQRNNAKKRRVYSPINAVGQYGMGHYYAPAPKEHHDTWYKPSGEGRDAVILRNPHLAAGEDALLMPLEGKDAIEYEKKYGRLNGLCMVSCACFTTINGADSDGDRASIITDDTVVGAVRNAVRYNNRVLKNVIDKKQAIRELLQNELDALKPAKTKKKKKADARRTGDADYAQYLLALKELVESLPDELGEMKPDVCPPLIYAGSGAGGKLYMTQEANRGSALKHAFWETFLLTTEQSIGRMSLEALDSAARAYRTEHVLDKPAEEPDAKQALHDFLLCWRTISGGLITALEIDMAKTSVRPGAHALMGWMRAVDDDFFGRRRTAEGRPGGSLFRKYRDKYVAQGGNLAGIGQMHQFEKELRQMLDDIAPKQRPEQCHPLDLLPWIVFTAWREKKAGLPGMGDALAKPKSFADALGWKPAGPEKKEDGKETLARSEMRKELLAYGKLVHSRRQEEMRRAVLASSYHACMRYVLRRYPMVEGMCRMEKLLPTGGSGESCLMKRLFKKKYANKICEINKKLQEEPELAKFVWENDPEKRKAAYQALGVDWEAECIAQSDAADMMLGRASDIYLFKQYIKYLVQENELERHWYLSSGGIHTPAALRQTLIGKRMQGRTGIKDLRPVLYNLCMEILGASNGFMKDEDNQQVKVLSEFLVIHLLGDYLVEQFAPAQEAAAKGKGGEIHAPV